MKLLLLQPANVISELPNLTFPLWEGKTNSRSLAASVIVYGCFAFANAVNFTLLGSSSSIGK